MNHDHNPQAGQMGDPSMARTLAHQAQAIWPQESRLFDRYNLSGPLRILDLGCGTGEITRRLARRYPQAMLVGVDILDGNLAIARGENSGFEDRIRYERGDAFALDFHDDVFDLIVCRHMSQAVPHFGSVLDEMDRVLRPGGRLHLLSEDYGMLHIPVLGGRDPDEFWNKNAIAFLQGIGCDGRIGRHTPPLLEARGYHDIAMEYVTVDTLRVPRQVFGGIIRAWRDGFAASLAAASGRERAEVTADFDSMITAIETPPQYAVWHVPVISARKPDQPRARERRR